MKLNSFIFFSLQITLFGGWGRTSTSNFQKDPRVSQVRPGPLMFSPRIQARPCQIHADGGLPLTARKN